MNAFGLIVVAGTKPKCMIKFIFSFKKKPTGEGNYNYPVGLDTMPAVTVGVWMIQFSVSNTLFQSHWKSNPIMVILRKKEIAAIPNGTQYLKYIQYVKQQGKKKKL